MAQLAGYGANREELLKSKLSSEDEDYTHSGFPRDKEEQVCHQMEGIHNCVKGLLQKEIWV